VKGIGRVSPMKSKVIGKGDSPRNSQVNVNESDKAPVVGVGADKLFDLFKDKANAVKDKVKDMAVDVINDKALDFVKETRKTNLLNDKPKDKAPPVDKSKDKDLPVVKESAKDKPAMDVVNDKALDVANEKRKAEVTKDKPNDKASFVVKDRVLEVVRPVVDVVKDKPVVDVVKDKSEVVKSVTDVIDKPIVDVVKDNAPEVVKERRKTELLKDKPKGKASFVVKSKAKHKADLLKDKPKPKDKNNVVSKVHVLRSKSKSKKIKTKAELKIKRKSGSDSDSMSIDEEKVMRMLKKLKKIKKEDFDEESGLKSKKKDSIKFDRFPVVRTRPAIRDRTSTLMRHRHDLEIKEHVIGCLELHDEWTESELQETEGFTMLSSLETFEQEALFKKAEEKLATFCSERVFLEDLMRKASSVYPDYGNVDEDSNDKEPLSSDPSFGFSKVRLDDFDKHPSGRGPLTPDRMPTRASKVSPSPKKQIVKPSSYMLSPYLNKKTKVVPRIIRLEFIIGNSLFAMQGDKMVPSLTMKRDFEMLNQKQGTFFLLVVLPCFENALYAFNAKMEIGLLSNPSVTLFFVVRSCSACSRVFTRDIYEDHVVSCAGIVGIKHHHSIVRDTLVDICFWSGISTGKEVDIRLGGGRDKPLLPANLLLYSWDKGLDICVDLTGSSPLTQTEMVDFVSVHAVIEAAQHKRVKYEARCADIGYDFSLSHSPLLGNLRRMRCPY
nr:ulp1 protease family, C-terminal catalytic domain-containing protein [Tanacetum cinerariifolium]